MTASFRPTHRITTNRETVDVMTFTATHNSPGPAFTSEEWEASDAADYERDELGQWFFQGKAFSGRVERIYKVAFVIESTGGFEVFETFSAAGNDAANDYAEQNYSGRPWYVLNANGENING
jgi:hypothetical protein